ncbi:MAG: GlcNAc-transferase family protein [Pseudomonadota bacterium]
MTIFVSIAAYRDPELIPTIEDCLARARWPGELRFGVCWQHAPGEARPRPLDRGRMRLLDIPWQHSQGACWARAECMKLYQGEDWFLQLDSHHRFVQDWDALLLDQAARTGAAKPLLTTYGKPFDPAAPLPPGVPTSIAMPAFRRDGIPVFQCRLRPDWLDGAPVRARFLSAHLLFAPGSFVAEVAYDPELYFYGEEITLAARAFSHGYDLFHPGAHVLWHQEPRRVTPLHWEDHVAAAVAVTARERDAASLAKVRAFLTRPPVGAFGCGTSRNFQQYESYVGVNFRRRYIGPAARRGDEPFPPAATGSADLKTWNIRIVLDRETVPPPALDRPSFWYVGFHDGEQQELARADARAAEITRALATNQGAIVLERQIRTAQPPQSWTVWPTDRQGRWLGKLSGPIDAACLA